MWREGTPRTRLVCTPIWAPTMEVSVEFVGERKLELSRDPAIPPLGKCQQRRGGGGEGGQDWIGNLAELEPGSKLSSMFGTCFQDGAWLGCVSQIAFSSSCPPTPLGDPREPS